MHVLLKRGRWEEIMDEVVFLCLPGFIALFYLLFYQNNFFYIVLIFKIFQYLLFFGPCMYKELDSGLA